MNWSGRSISRAKPSRRSLAIPRSWRASRGDLVFPRELSLVEQSHYLSLAVDKIRYDGLPRSWHEIIGRKQATP